MTKNEKTEVENHHETLERSHHAARRIGLITILLIFGLFGLWSVFADISTTITAQGKVITDTYNKTVMYPSGGIVKQIFVKEGTVVKKGDKLLEIDSTDFKANLNSAISHHDANLFAICRLEAQASFAEALDCSKIKNKMLDPASYEKLRTDTISLFNSEMKSLKSKEILLQSKNNILLEQNKGLEDQIKSNEKILETYRKELAKWKKLLKRNAVDEQGSIDTERKIMQIEEQINTLKSRIRENQANIEANKRQMDYEKETFKKDALTELNKNRLDNTLLKEKINAYRNQLMHATVKSPSEGKVTDMKIHAAGEVVSPYKPIMSIVPLEQKLTVEAYVNLTDIEKIHVGQKTEISFPSFVDPSAVPIIGELTYISADSVVPEGRRESFYRILVKFTPKGLTAIKKNGFNIVPGMPASVFVKTGKTTLMEYILRPFILLSKGIFNAN